MAPLWEYAPLLVGMFPCLSGCFDAAHRATICRTRGRRLYSLLASANTCSNVVCNDGAELQSCDVACIRPQRNTDDEVCLGMSYSFLFVSSCASMQTVQKNKKNAPRLEPPALGLKARRATAEPNGRPNGSTRTAARPNPFAPRPRPQHAPHTHTHTHTHGGMCRGSSLGVRPASRRHVSLSPRLHRCSAQSHKMPHKRTTALQFIGFVKHVLQCGLQRWR